MSSTNDPNFANSLDPGLAAMQFQEFMSSYRTAAGRAPRRLKHIIPIFGNSPAMGQILIRFPTWADGPIKEVAPTKEGALEFKYRGLIDIAARDIARLTKTQRLMREWSYVADQCVKLALTAVGAPKKGFAVIALGKLGGMELNYSSDIDIIFIYNDPVTFEDAQKIANRLIQFLSEPPGFLFRVDTNLRPEGSRGPIAMSLDAIEIYYEQFGTDWERQALIRARPIAGDIGNEFIRRIRPFVYRKNIDPASLMHIREMKDAIDRQEAQRGRDQLNIKLCPGGIREAEFFVQALQMIHAGRIPALMTPSMLTALDILKKEGVISKRDYRELHTGYIFLRRAENMLQIADERQTHIVDLANPGGLARRMGLDTSTLIGNLNSALNTIRRQFISLFEIDYETRRLTEEIEENMLSAATDEERIDSIPWFKNRATNFVRGRDLAGKMGVFDVSARLTKIADVVLREAFKLATQILSPAYGPPLTAGLINRLTPAKIGVVGMGGYGAGEMDYGSDLDILFIYSGQGDTSGPAKITNHEYFTKLAQKVMSVLQLPTRYGRAYAIDAELRPSGRAGTLVTSVKTFENYHLMEAMVWERIALLKARPVAGDLEFCEELRALLKRLAYDPPMPHDAARRIHEIRMRMETERGRDSPGAYDIKLGRGGLADVEAIVGFLTLTHGKDLGSPMGGVATLLNSLHNAGFLTQGEYQTMERGLLVYRSILMRARLFGAHAMAGLDTNAAYFASLVQSLNMWENPKECIDEVERLRGEVREIYVKYGHL